MLINSYKYCAPPKALAREMLFFSRYCYLFFKNGFQNKTILFYPDFPYKKTEILELISRTNFNVTNNPNLKFDYVFHWEDVTVRSVDPVLENLSKHHHVINFRCQDISKTNVDKVFTEVFGYSTQINPLTHQGKCVKKSIYNGLHDGKVIDCPVLSVEEGYIYQKLFNNISANDPTFTEEYRFTIVGDTLISVTARNKSIHDRFDKTLKARRIEPTEEFSAQELQNVFAFCGRLGLEYGELDVMRDSDDGRLYILDANNTPTKSTYRRLPGEEEGIWSKGAQALLDTYLRPDPRIIVYPEPAPFFDPVVSYGNTDAGMSPSEGLASHSDNHSPQAAGL